MKHSLKIILLAALLCLHPQTGPSATFVVTNTADSGPGTLRQVVLHVNAVNDGVDDVITFGTGVTGTITLTTGELVVTKTPGTLTIAGPGAKYLTLLNLTDRVFELMGGSGVTILGLTLSGHLAGADGSDGNPVAQHFGGYPGSEAYGGAIRNLGSLTMSNCVLQNCSARGGKGGSGVEVLITGLSFSDYTGPGANGANAYGGAIYTAGRDLTLYRCTFSGNQAAGGRGGNGAPWHALSNPPLGNQGGLGGSAYGGDIYTDYGGGIGRLYAYDCTFYSATAAGGNGGNGGDNPEGGPVGAGGNGGNAYGGSTYQRIGCLEEGCGFYSCTLNGNSVVPGLPGLPGDPGGGNVYSLNALPGLGAGGGIYAGGLNLRNTILAGNEAVGLATTSVDGTGLIASQGHNLIGDSTGIAWNPGPDATDLLGALDPLLGPLLDNGGPTPTLALLPGSPAIDTGINTDLATDQRGWPRTFDDPSVPNVNGSDGTDIGAYELQPAPAIWTNLSSGKWETAVKWLNRVLPGAGLDVYITNASSKTVTMDQSTVLNAPATLTVANLLVANSGADVNTLVVDIGNANTFTVFHELIGKASGNVQIISGQVNCPSIHTVVVDGQFLLQGGALSVGSGQIGQAAAGSFVGTGGSAQFGTLQVASGSDASLTNNGSSLSVSNNFIIGALPNSSGTVALQLGTLNVTNPQHTATMNLVRGLLLASPGVNLVVDNFLQDNGAGAAVQLSGASLTASSATIGPGATLTATGGSQLTLLSGANYGTIDARSAGSVLLGPTFYNGGTFLGPTNSCCPEGAGVKYVQPPDLTNGIDVIATYSPPDPNNLQYWVLADDFPCTNTGAITDIHLWGSWLFDRIDPNARFTLAIWSDVPTNSLSGFSHPGNLLWTQTYSNSQYTLCPYVTNHTEFFDAEEPGFGIVYTYGVSSNLYYLCFNVNSTNTFTQTGTQTAPTNYWLSVTAQTTPNSASYFGWKSSSTAYHDNAVGANPSTSIYPQPGDWWPLFGCQGCQTNPLNLAFKINTATNSGPTNLPTCCPEGPGLKYVQYPNLTNGVDVDASFYPIDQCAYNAIDSYSGAWILADDFPCTNAGFITDIHLWGSWLNDRVDPNAAFNLAIWSDVPTNGNSFSHPGVQLWSQTYSSGQYSMCISNSIGETFEEIASPPSSPADPSCVLSGRSTNLYYLCFNVPPPSNPTNTFFQTGQPNARTNYWLSVTVMGTNYFGWKSSATAYNDYAVAAQGWSASFPQLGGNWHPLGNYGGYQNFNLAFKINTSTNCTGPTLLCSSLTVGCSDVWQPPIPQVLDNCCATNGQPALASSSIDGYCPTVYQYNWVYTNCQGHSASCSSYVTVTSAPPTILCSSTNITCGTPIPTNPPTVIDACCSNVIPFLISSVTNNNGCGRTIVRVWEAVDCICTNLVSTCTQTISVLPGAPTLLCGSLSVYWCDNSYTNPPAVIDSCCTNVQVTLLGSTSSFSGCGGTVTQQWRFVDLCCTNTNTCTRIVTILPSVPTPNCSPLTVSCGDYSYTNPPPYSDPCCANVLKTLLSSITVTNGCGSTITQAWRFVDLCCNTTNTCTRTVTVVPSGPSLSCSNLTVSCGDESYTNPPAASDLCCTNGVNVTLLSRTTITNGCGKTVYQVWQATDCCNNSQICTQVVTVTGNNTLVVPHAWATLEGSGASPVPFDLGAIGSSSCRYQQVYAASEFGAIPAGGALITAIALRVDGSSSSFGATLPAVQINLSTTAKAPDGLDTTFVNNVGSDDTVVFPSGPLPLSSVAVGNPRAFDIVIPLTTPFHYNPATGNLLLDVRNTGGGTTTLFDTVGFAGDGVSRIYHHSNAASSVADSIDSGGLITLFTFGPPLQIICSNITIACGNPFPTNPPAYLDLCCTNAILILLNSTTNSGCTNVITQNWLATDCCNNSTNCTRTITILPGGPPQLVCSNLVLFCGDYSYTNPPVCLHPCCPNVTVSLLNSSSGGTACSQMITQTWQAVDLCCGGSDVCSRTVTLLPSPPTLLCGSLTVCGGPVPTNPPAVVSPCCASNTVTLLNTTTITNNCGETIYRTWQATDCCSNTTICTQVVNVVLGVPATVVVPNTNANVSGGGCNTYPFDIAANSIPNQRYQQVYSSSQFATMPAGGAWITAVAFRACVAFGQTTLPHVQVDLSTTSRGPDGLDPTLFGNNVGADDRVVFNGPLTLSSSGSPLGFDVVIPLTAPFFYNPAAGNLLLDVRNFGGGGTTAPLQSDFQTGDSVSREYGGVASANGGTDTGGLVTQFTFGTPALTLLCGSTNIPCGSPIPTNPPAYSDVCCGSVLLTSLGSTTNLGGCGATIYQAWRATDQCCGNSVTCTQIVNVIAGPPQLVCSNFSVECGASWAFTPPLVLDSCCASPAVPHLSATSAVRIGPCQTNYLGTWAATNCCGLYTVCTQIVSVVDTIPPVFVVCPTNILLTTCTLTNPVTWSAAATDVCSAVTIISTPPSGTGFHLGTTNVIHCVATDACGNSNTCSFTITVARPPLGGLTIVMTNEIITITWSGGVLMGADEVLGPYTDVSSVSPYSVAANLARRFYRLRCSLTP